MIRLNKEIMESVDFDIQQFHKGILRLCDLVIIELISDSFKTKVNPPDVFSEGYKLKMSKSSFKELLYSYRKLCQRYVHGPNENDRALIGLYLDELNSRILSHNFEHVKKILAFLKSCIVRVPQILNGYSQIQTIIKYFFNHIGDRTGCEDDNRVLKFSTQYFIIQNKHIYEQSTIFRSLR